jgi:hypothetical protein
MEARDTRQEVNHLRRPWTPFRLSYFAICSQSLATRHQLSEWPLCGRLMEGPIDSCWPVAAGVIVGFRPIAAGVDRLVSLSQLTRLSDPVGLEHH